MTGRKDALRQALYDAVSRIPFSEPIGVAFSGGIDSSLLAKICADLGANLILLTVGFPESPDIVLSRKIAKLMGIRHQIGEISDIQFPTDLRSVAGMIACKNTSHIENCIAYWYIAKLAAQNGIDTVLSANGCDELFCGYDSYREAYNLGEKAILQLMNAKIANELELVKEIRMVVKAMGIRVEQPFLSPQFISFSRTIPISDKITGSNDLVRKQILRQVALEIGVPEEAATKPKKALQYGTHVDKHLKKIPRRSSAYIEQNRWNKCYG